jgi:hypothetical protein
MKEIGDVVKKSSNIRDINDLNRQSPRSSKTGYQNETSGSNFSKGNKSNNLFGNDRNIISHRA